VIGALVVKSAAHQVDQRARLRHLQDSATLFASIETVADLPIGDLSRNDRRRLLHLFESIGDTDHEAWMSLTSGERARGHQSLHRLALRLG
jgi:hypothetical protein